MYIGDHLIEKLEVYLQDKFTTQERQRHLEVMAKSLLWTYWPDIQFIKNDKINFSVEVDSKINRIALTNEEMEEFETLIYFASQHKSRVHATINNSHH
jgi:hypothetical protein